MHSGRGEIPFQSNRFWSIFEPETTQFFNSIHSKYLLHVYKFSSFPFPVFTVDLSLAISSSWVSYHPCHYLSSLLSFCSVLSLTKLTICGPHKGRGAMAKKNNNEKFKLFDVFLFEHPSTEVIPGSWVRVQQFLRVFLLASIYLCSLTCALLLTAIGSKVIHFLPQKCCFFHMCYSVIFESSVVTLYKGWFSYS